MSQKIAAAILGTGNIGSDLLRKILRSPYLTCGLFTGRNPDSEGIRQAQALGVRTSADSIRAIEQDPDCCEIVFDTTSAAQHILHAPLLKKLGKFVVDMTPSRVGKMCVPALNLSEAIEADNVNLITCGGQTCIPLAKAIMEAHPDTTYIEIVGSIASKSAGPGTRANIEEYIQTTKNALEHFSGVPKAKAILVLNPAEPPILMHNTIYATIPYPDINRLREHVTLAAEQIQKYVPGFKVILGPVLEGDRMVIMVEVVGQGDFLPSYAGNLDIITCAAVQVAEEYAKQKLTKLDSYVSSANI